MSSSLNRTPTSPPWAALSNSDGAGGGLSTVTSTLALLNPLSGLNDSTVSRRVPLATPRLSHSTAYGCVVVAPMLRPST